MPGIPNPTSVSTKLHRIAELARKMPHAALHSLSHHIDVEWLKEAFRRTRKSGAVGVDGQTAKDYEQNLEENLRSLLNRFKSGTYRAPPVRRVHIPKGDGKTRPIGIPTFEDKVLQRAVAMVLEAIYEQDFLDCSFGFRPGRSAHQALETLREYLAKRGGGQVLEVDIQAFFDTLDHGQLRNFLDQRVSDGVLRRTIDKWLKAGVLEAGSIKYSDDGTPQGGVISPILANVYLHVVLDQWFKQDVQPRLVGQAQLVRYADDAAIAFTSDGDAQRVMEVLPKRFGKYGLTLHPTKTRQISFQRPPHRPDAPAPTGHVTPGTFDMLGFTHHWGISKQRRWKVARKTSKVRLKRAMSSIDDWCRKNRYVSVKLQHRILTQKLRGHYQYYGITGNSEALEAFRRESRKSWRRWLNRRSQRTRMTWDRFERLEQRYPLPPAIVVHSIYRRRANS